MTYYICHLDRSGEISYNHPYGRDFSIALTMFVPLEMTYNYVSSCFHGVQACVTCRRRRIPHGEALHYYIFSRFSSWDSSFRRSDSLRMTVLNHPCVVTHRKNTVLTRTIIYVNIFIIISLPQSQMEGVVCTKSISMVF